tara:strand:- start:1059 stop:1184 length:126 start_codon:yes stop_codon:yes gene_type:complete
MGGFNWQGTPSAPNRCSGLDVDPGARGRGMLAPLPILNIDI